MKVCFLDIDGVLCTYGAHVASGGKGVMEALDVTAVRLINQLPVDFFVLSSTWRKIHPKEWMEDHLRLHDWTGKFHDDWRTKAYADILPGRGFSRGVEIADWLERHPEVIGYVILDDDSDMLPEQMDNFVKTSGMADGLRFLEFERARAILAGKKFVEPIFL